MPRPLKTALGSPNSTRGNPCSARGKPKYPRGTPKRARKTPRAAFLYITANITYCIATQEIPPA